MRCAAFGVRTAKEIIRDPLSVTFGLGFPIVLLLLLSAIQANLPVSLFEIESLAPGIAVFGLAFMTLFSATLIVKDRESSFMSRLLTTPLTSVDFMIGYTLPIFPIAVLQGVCCYAVAVILGLKVTVGILYALLAGIPVSLIFIALGLFFGSFLSVKQVGGICGALLTNLTAWLSGVWFDLELVGGAFKKIAYMLPFVHAVELERAALRCDMAGFFPHIWWVTGYCLLLFAAAILMFLRTMRKG